MSTYRAVFLGFLVAAIALVIADARRGNTSVSVPNHAEVNYVIPAGTSTTPVAVPANNSPVTFNLSVIGGTTRGVSSVVICYSTAAPATLAWAGHCPTSGGSGATAVAGSTTTVSGTSIIPLNSTGDVLLRVSSALNKVELVNNSASSVNAVLEWTF
jgi:hypothetical protein